MDSLLGGLSDSTQAVHDFLAGLGNIRNPRRTPVLADLEYEFGLITDSTQSLAQRQNILAAQMYQRNGRGSAPTLQAQLNVAGFSQCLAYQNDPAVDPRPFLAVTFAMCAGLASGAGNSYAGYYTGGSSPPYAAFAGAYGFCELVVNGAQFQNNPQYISCGYFPASVGYVQCQTPTMYTYNYAGGYFYQKQVSIPWAAPADSWAWPLVFFVAGSATRDGNGYITALTPAQVPASQVPALKRIILKYKPLHTWCVLAYNAV
jgi:hypothetical protein